MVCGKAPMHFFMHGEGGFAYFIIPMINLLLSFALFSFALLRDLNSGRKASSKFGRLFLSKVNIIFFNAACSSVYS